VINRPKRRKTSRQLGYPIAVRHQVVRTWDLRTDDGRVFGFEISNSLITRHGVVKTIGRIPGVTVTRGTQYGERRSDVFCDFLLDGLNFHAAETNGDSSRYWIYADHETGFPHIPTVRLVFARRKLFGTT